MRRTRENLEVHVLHDLSHFRELHLHAQVWLVRAVLEHRVLVSHDGEYAQVHTNRITENSFDHALEEFTNLFFGHERRFNIYLREFGLAIGSQVFVAKTFGDLVVTVKARHHQQLLEQLRRLGQCKELAVMYTARYQIVTRALRRALGEHRCLYIYKTIGV